VPYYSSIDLDLKRAEEILAKGKAEPHEEGGTIYGADIYAAHMLLKSFVEHIRYLHQQMEVGQAERERLEFFKAKAIKLNRTAHETINMLLERQTELQVKLDAATERIAKAMRES
jgi:hypothetical protein